jgi:hypothetical protein
MTAEDQAWKPEVYMMLMKCRRELLAKLEDVIDPVPVVANYFDRQIDALYPGAQVKVKHLEGQQPKREKE